MQLTIGEVVTGTVTPVRQTDRTRSSNGEQQSQTGGDTGVKAHIKIQEALHPELHHSA